MSEPKTRFHAIDNLRTAMMFVVMFGHPMLPYVTVPRSFKDPATSVGFDAVGIFLYAFAMQVFFVTAGFTAALVRERKGVAGLWRNRLGRIFLPLLVGYILLTPLTRAAYDFAKAVVAGGTLAAGMDVFAAGEWLRWSKLYHLWFLLSLLLFTALALFGARVLRGSPLASALQRLVARATASRWRTLWLTLALTITTAPAYVYGAGSGTSPWMQVTMFGFFAFGWLLYAERDLLVRFKAGFAPELIAVVLVLPLCVWSTQLRLFNEDTVDIPIGLLAGATNALVAAAMTFALLGIAGRYFDKATPASIWLGDASYWVYLVHLPIVVAAGGAFAVLDAPAIVKYLATLAVAIPLILASYRLVAITPLGPVIAGTRKPTGG